MGSGKPTVWDCPPSKGRQTNNQEDVGGQHVWDCPPSKGRQTSARTASFCKWFGIAPRLRDAKLGFILDVDLRGFGIAPRLRDAKL